MIKSIESKSDLHPGKSTVLMPASIAQTLLAKMNVSHEMVMQPSLWIHKTKSDEIQMLSVRTNKSGAKMKEESERKFPHKQILGCCISVFSLEIEAKQRIK